MPDGNLLKLNNHEIIYYKDGVKYHKLSQDYIGKLKWLWQDFQTLFPEIDHPPFLSAA